MDALQVVMLLAIPLAAQWLARHVGLFKALGPVLICYLVGIGLANQPLVALNDPLSQDVTGGAVVLAIPLLLLSTDFIGWVRHGGSAVLSFSLAAASVATAATVTANAVDWAPIESWKVAGMLVGVYTGGTANLASIGRALDVGDETYFLLNASDVLLSGAYLLFLMTVAKPLLSLFLPQFQGNSAVDENDGHGEDAGASDAVPTGTLALGMAKAFGVAAAIGGLSVGASFAITGKIEDVIIIVGITTGGILASLIKPIRAIKGSYALGNYFILTFCVAIGSLTDLSALMESGTTLFYFTASVIFSAIVLHIILAAVFRIDVDTVMITSTAAVFGPPFVAMIADNLGNKQVLLSGLTTGLVGYAVGNYLGLLVAYALQP